MKESSSKIFELYSKYYDLIYSNKDYYKEVCYIHKLLKKHGLYKKTLLEFGSGTGKHARHFVKKGYKVHGIEKSHAMTARCRKINGFTFQQGDIRTTKIKKKYEIILALFHVFSYQVKNQDLDRLFKNARHHLKMKGVLGFDFWYTPAVNFQKPKIRLLEIKKKNFKLMRLAEPTILKKKIVKVNYTILIKNLFNKKIDIIKESHLMRHFSLTELSRLFVKHRFICLHTRELSSNRKPGKKTWGVFCLLQKY